VKFVFIAAIATIIARGILSLVNPTALNAPEPPKPVAAHVQARAEGPVATISGRVVDARTGEPLIGASVVVEGTELGNATDLHGEYLIARVPVGTHKLGAFYTGYRDLATTVVSDSISGVRVDFYLAVAVPFKGYVE
jgi:hypothetical protein